MKTLKNLLVLAMLITVTSIFTSCSDDEQVETVEEINKSKEIEELRKLKEREKKSTTEEQPLVDPKDVKPPTNG